MIPLVLRPRDFPWAQAISILLSQYRHSHLPNNGSPGEVAYASVTAVAANVDAAVDVELVALVKSVLATM